MKYIIKHHTEKGSQKRGLRDMNEDFKIVDIKNKIFIVADGMGGHNSPGIASSVASQYMYNKLVELKQNYNYFAKTMPYSEETILNQIKEYIESCNNFIFFGGDSSADTKETSTTLDTCLIIGNRAYFGHVGNGRIYKLNNEGILTQLSEEHVEYPETINERTPLRKRVLEIRKGLDSYIGMNPLDGILRVDTFSMDINVGEILWMETDGISHRISHSELEHVLNVCKSEEAFSTNLKDALNYAVANPSDIVEEYAIWKRLKDGQGIDIKKAKEILKNDDKTYIGIKRVT